MYFFEDYTLWSAVTAVVRLLWRRSCFHYNLFRRPEQPQQYSFEDYFMVGIYIRLRLLCLCEIVPLKSYL